MSIKQFFELVSSDLYRYTGQVSWRNFILSIIRKPGLRFSFWMRLCSYSNGCFVLYPIHLIAKLFHRYYMFKFGISIPYTTSIGTGFYIGHFGDIVVSSHAIIGSNCNISQGVTIGKHHRGKREGYPKIGNNVYIAPGVKVIGNVTIGDNVAIGANSVVLNDVPDNSVIVGVPGKIVSKKGTKNLLHHLWQG